MKFKYLIKYLTLVELNLISSFKFELKFELAFKLGHKIKLSDLTVLSCS